jgi:AraC-like DNA-binding protein
MASAHSFPAIHVLELLRMMRGFGLGAQELLAGSGVTEEALETRDARVSISALQQVVGRAVALTGQPGLGIMLGLRMRVPAHGYLGFAALTAPTLRHAIELAVRYSPTRTTALGLRFEEGEPSSLYIDEYCELGAARETVLYMFTVGLWRIGEELTGRRLSGVAEYAFPEPAARPHMSGAPVSVVYGQPAHRLRFSRGYLELPLIMAEPSASLLAQEQCERELEALDRDTLVERVRGVLPRPEGGVRNVDEVAAALGISVRTLHRKLKAEGIVFSDLSKALQQREACRMLADASLSIEQVAESVGYSDVSSFTRAFRRWTGTTPAVYRRSH